MQQKWEISHNPVGSEEPKGRFCLVLLASAVFEKIEVIHSCLATRRQQLVHLSLIFVVNEQNV